MRLGNSLRIIISVFFLYDHGYAQSIDSVYAVANKMYAHGEYTLSTELYKRVAYFDKTHQYDTVVYTALAAIYYNKSEYIQSNVCYELALQKVKNKDSANLYKMRKVRNFIMTENYFSAITQLDSINANSDTNIARNKKFLYAICFFGIEEYDSSMNCFIGLIPSFENERKEEIKKLFNKVKHGANHRYLGAVILSYIIPGSGQILLGNTRDGINAFLLTSAFAALTISTAITYTPIEAALSAFPWWFRYYRGNINHVKEQAEWKRFHRRSELYQKVLSTVNKSGRL